MKERSVKIFRGARGYPHNYARGFYLMVMSLPFAFIMFLNIKASPWNTKDLLLFLIPVFSLLLGWQMSGLRPVRYALTDEALLIRHAIGRTKIPYSKMESIIPDSFILTEVGRDSIFGMSSTKQLIKFSTDYKVTMDSYLLLGPTVSKMKGDCLLVKLAEKNKCIVITPRNMERFIEEISNHVKVEKSETK